MNLYYYDEFGDLKCFDSNIKQCGEKGTEAEDYPIQIYNDRQCVKICFGFLSPSEDICYIGNEQCPENSKKGIYEGKIKCDCQYKYYFDTNNKKKCLSKDENCPNEYTYIIQDKNECVKNCDEYNIIFDNKCLESCPYPLTENEEKKSCECAQNWYKTSENKYVCLGEDEICTNEYPYLIEDTKECVQKCNKTNYDIFYNNKCISSCEDNNMKKVEVKEGYPTFEISPYTCRCKNGLKVYVQRVVIKHVMILEKVI